MGWVKWKLSQKFGLGQKLSRVDQEWKLKVFPSTKNGPDFSTAPACVCRLCSGHQIPAVSFTTTQWRSQVTDDARALHVFALFLFLVGGWDRGYAPLVKFAS